MLHVVYVTASRAEYGIVRNYLKLMDNDEDIDLGIVVTGSLLEEKYGMQVELIEKDGFNIQKRLPINVDSKTNNTILHTMSRCQDKFADYFSKEKIDLVIILGDRYEMLPVAITAAMNKVPILHIHGGEATYGNYDEFIRHSITKMSTYHFTTTERYRNRVIQLGENPKRVYNLGSLGAENATLIDEKKVELSVKSIDEKKYFVVLFHPETLTNICVLDQVNELLNAISCFKEYKFVFLGTNADTNSDIIRTRIKSFIESNDNTIYFENLDTNSYQYLLKNSLALIGNSSSGIIEAPSLNIYTINIGDRQKGRERAKSVIDVPCIEKNIKESIKSVIKNKSSLKNINPYFKKDAAINYYKTTKKILADLKKDNSIIKEFYDIEMASSLKD